MSPTIARIRARAPQATRATAKRLHTAPHSRFVAAAGLALALAGFEGRAFAQPEYEKATADALFERGLKKMQKGEQVGDCSELTESQHIYPQPGTLFTLAECEAQAGRISTALSYYEAYLKLYESMGTAQQEKQHAKGRDTASAEKIKELKPLVPQLTLTLAANSPKTTELTLDKQRLDPSSIGVPISLDPGAHVVTAQAPGGPVSEERVTIDKGEKKEIRLAPAAAAKTDEGPKAPEAGGTHRVVGLILVSAGGLAAMGGGFAAGLAFGKKTSVDNLCPGDACGAAGEAWSSGANGMIGVGAAGLAVGAAAIAVGAYFLSKDAPAPQKHAASLWLAPRVDVGPSGVTLGAAGAF